MHDTTPVLIGGGQYTQRNVDPATAKSPLEMMVECARQAARDAGLTPAALTQLDRVMVANIFSWPYGNAPRLLADELSAQPAELIYTTVGGNTPQWLVNETAEKIARGECRFALLAGAEAVSTVRHAQRAGIALAWKSGGDGRPTVVGDRRPGNSEIEGAYSLQLPAQIYPLFENAIRAHRRWSIAEHREKLGRLCSALSAVAARNPNAWFPQARSAEEITTVTPNNRMVAFPYPKFMNAIIDVDQAAAVLMTSATAARELGVPESRWVYLNGCADTHDHWFVTERVNYHSSPAIRIAGQRALAMAGLDIGDIDFFDIYSCFPCAVQIGRDMLGIAEDDPRPLTVTGGLPYHGGPGNNYSTHAIATMLDRVREKPGSRGLVTALGWYITKHSIGIYSTERPKRPWQREDPASYQKELDAMPHPEVVAAANGPATIETYTVIHDRDGAPVRGLVIARLEDGRRCLAELPPDRLLLESIESSEGIGLRGQARHEDGLNRLTI